MARPSSKAQEAVFALRNHKIVRLEHPALPLNSKAASEDQDTFWLLNFVSADGQRDRCNLKFMEQAGNLGPPIRRAFFIWGQGAKQRTRRVVARNLRVGLFTYLEVTGHLHVPLDNLDGVFFSGFIRWLNQPRAEMEGKPWAHGTRNAMLSPVRTLFLKLKTDSQYAAIAKRITECIPSNPWPGITTKSTPVVRMQLDDLKQVVAACEYEIDEIRKRFAESSQLLETTPDSFARCLRLFSQRFVGVLPTRREIQTKHRDLFPFVKTTD